MIQGLRILWLGRIEETRGFNSLTIIPTQQAKAVLDLDPRVTVSFPVHENFAADKKWLANYAFEQADLDRLEVWPMPKSVVGGSPAARRLGYMAGPALFNRLKPLSKEAQFVDAILVDGAPAIIPAIRVATTPTFTQGYSRDIPVLSMETWTPTNRWKDSVFGPFDAPACVLGSLYADHIFYQSQWCMDDHLDDYRRLLKPSVLSTLMDKMEVGNGGVWSDRLPWKQYDGRKPTILWTGHYAEDFVPVCKAMVKAYEAGYAEKLVFHFMISSTGASELPSHITDMIPKAPWAEIRTEMPQGEYWKFVLEADLVVGLGSAMHQYGGRYVEMVSMGLPFLTNHIYARIITPPGETYLFKVEKESDLPNTLMAASAAIQQNPGICRDFATKVRAYHDVRRTGAQLYGKMQELVWASMQRLDLGGLDSDIADIIQNECPLTHADFVSRLEKRMAKPQDLRANPIFPPGVLRWAALKQGAVDVGGIGQPIYQYGN